MRNHVDVVVVGAGPVGLLTAIELTLGGVRVLVLERLNAPSDVMKALGMGPLGIEALERRGMAAAVAKAEECAFAAMKKSQQQNATSAIRAGAKFAGHFGGLMLIRANAQKEPDRRNGRVNQQFAEAMLAERALALGIEVRRDCEVKGLVQDADGVDVKYATPTGENEIRCSYLIGCDGGRSLVRKMAGFEFPGTPPTMTMYSVTAEIDHPELLSNGFIYTAGGMYIYGFLPGQLALMDFSGPPADREAPVTREETEAVLRRITGEDLRVNAVKDGRRWTDNTRLADTYRRGRVLLAGDAAHIHAPFGGQGMSLGLVDAANLGWKLAAVILNQMPENLLDTYTAERRPVAEAILANTRAQAAIMRPDPQSAAMRNLVAKLMEFEDVNRFMGGTMSGLSIRYDLGSQRDEVGRLISNMPIGDGSLYEHMQDGMGVFLDASRGNLSELVTAHTQRIRCVSVETGSSMLIRPDACVAWAGDENSSAGLQEALGLWCIPASRGQQESHVQPGLAAAAIARV